MTKIWRTGLVGMAMAGVVAVGAGTAARADDLTVMTSVPGLNFPFFVHMMAEMQAEGKTLGVKTVESDGQNSAPKQTADVEAAVVQGVNGIVISPIDVNAMAPALKTAIDNGVPVVTIELPNSTRTPLDAEMRQMWLDLLRWMSERAIGQAPEHPPRAP